jgi:DNA-binding beta-propeller fold protein YncE
MTDRRATGAAGSGSKVFVAMCRAQLPLLAALWLCAGCPASGDEVRPPDDQFYFPTGMDIAPDESVLFVSSGNTDLRYDSGTVQVVDLDTLDAIVRDWLLDGSVSDNRDCDVDLMVPYTLVCDEREAINVEAGVRIGNFATDLKVQQLEDENALRLFLAVRGDPSLTWVDYDVDERELSCGDGGGAFPECDDAHRLVQLRNDEDFTALPDEPFGVYVDSDNGYVVTTHLSNGAISLADAPPDGGTPILSDAVGNLFAPDQFGQRGAVAAHGRLPGSDGDRIYVTSRVDSRIQTLVVAAGSGGFPVLVPTEYFFMNRAVSPSTDGRGIAFSSDGTRAYVVNRAPPMLHILDTSLDTDGVPRNEFVAGVELCAEASNLTVVEAPEPKEGEEAEDQKGDRVYVACFRNGQIWSIDPRGAVVDAIIDVGRGPHALAASSKYQRLYVSNNLESTIAVVDLTPGAETENRVVLRLGRPRSATGGNE